MLRPCLLCRLQRIGQSRLAVTGGVEVIGKPRHALRCMFPQIGRCGAVNLLPPRCRQPIEHSRSDLVVHEDATPPVGTQPNEAPSPSFVERGDGRGGLLPSELGGHGQLKFPPKHCPNGQQLKCFLGQQIQAPREEGRRTA